MDEVRVKRLIANIRVIRSSPTYVDDEWKTLHKWAADFRLSHHITIAEFLGSLELEVTSTFTQFLCKSKHGLRIPPSKKPDTVGYVLREKLKKAKQVYEELGDLPLIPGSFEERIRDVCEEFIYDNICDVKVCSISFENINEDDSSIVVSANGCIEDLNSNVVDDNRAHVEEKLSQYILEKLAFSIRVSVSKFTLLDPISSQNAMVCANVDGHGCGTVTLISHPSVECLIGITAKHVLSVCADLENRSIYCRAMSSNDNFLKSETKTPLFGYSSYDLLHEACDVGIMIPFKNTETIPNFVEKLGVVRLPSPYEAIALRILMTHRPNEFILAKQGCSTGRTTATIKPGSVTATQFCVTGRELCPVAYHGDSGALWVVIKSPSNLYNQLVVGVCSYIELVRKSAIVTIECYCTPVWLWLDWLVAVGEVIEEALL